VGPHLGEDCALSITLLSLAPSAIRESEEELGIAGALLVCGSCAVTTLQNNPSKLTA
jgi:hypothetical protein